MTSTRTRASVTVKLGDYAKHVADAYAWVNVAELMVALSTLKKGKTSCWRFCLKRRLRYCEEETTRVKEALRRCSTTRSS
jgi:hypothetical protein